MKKFKFILIALVSLWALISLSLPVFAADVVKSPIDPAVEVIGEGQYRVTFCYQLSSASSLNEAWCRAGTYVCRMTFTVDPSYHIEVGRGSYNSIRAYICDSSGDIVPPPYVHQQSRTIYDAQSGGIVYQRYQWSTTYTTIAIGPADAFPVAGGESSKVAGEYFAGSGSFDSTSLTVRVGAGTLSSPFVKFGYGNGYGFDSTLPQPIPDEYNRYLMLCPAGDASPYFYHFSLCKFDLAYTAPPVGTNVSYTFDFFNALRLSSNGQDGDHWSLILDPSSFLDGSAAGAGLFQNVEFDLVITKFSGLYGDFIESQYVSYHDNPYGVVTLWTDDGSFFQDYSLAKSILPYGISLDLPADGMGLNWANIHWSFDKRAQDWRDQMLTVTNNIYRALVSADVDIDPVTKPQDLIDGLRDAEDALTPTYSDGTPIDVVGEVDQAFQVGENALGDVQSARSSFNYQINKFLSLTPLLVVPIVVALSIGLVITILGKNKS